MRVIDLRDPRIGRGARSHRGLIQRFGNLPPDAGGEKGLVDRIKLRRGDMHGAGALERPQTPRRQRVREVPGVPGGSLQPPASVDREDDDDESPRGVRASEAAREHVAADRAEERHDEHLDPQGDLHVRELRQELGDRVRQAQQSALHQLQGRDGRDRLGHGLQLEQIVNAHRTLRVQIGKTMGFQRDQLAVARQQRHGAGHLVFALHAGDEGIDSGHALAGQALVLGRGHRFGRRDGGHRTRAQRHRAAHGQPRHACPATKRQHADVNSVSRVTCRRLVHVFRRVRCVRV